MSNAQSDMKLPTKIVFGASELVDVGGSVAVMGGDSGLRLPSTVGEAVGAGVSTGTPPMGLGEVIGAGVSIIAVLPTVGSEEATRLGLALGTSTGSEWTVGGGLLVMTGSGSKPQ